MTVYGQVPDASSQNLVGQDYSGLRILAAEQKLSPNDFRVFEASDGSRGRTSHDEPVDYGNSEYISVWAKLTRTFATHIVFCLVVLLFSLIMLSQAVKEKGEETKRHLRSGCNGMEVAATAMASIPRYAADGFNKATVKSINMMTKSMANMLSGTVAMLNELVLMVLQSYTSLLFCVLDAIVGAAVGTVSMFAEDITNFINNQLRLIQNALDKSLNVLNGQLQDFIEKLADAIETVAEVFGAQINNGIFSPISFPSVSGKLNFQIPLAFVDVLKNLGNDIPSFQSLGNQLGDLISIPFKRLEALIDADLAGLHGISAQTELIKLPVAAARVSFCEDAVDYTWVDTIVKAFNYTIYVGVGVIAAVALLSILANIWMTLYSHWQFEQSVGRYAKILSEHQGIERLAPSSKQNYTTGRSKEDRRQIRAIARDLMHAAASPALYIFINTVARTLRFSHQGKVRFRWFVDYVSHKPSLLCLSAGIMGLGMIYLQLFLIDSVKEKTSTEVQETVNQSMDKLSVSILSVLYGIADPYVVDTNEFISDVEETANTVLFGWIGEIMGAVNRTMSVFETGFDDVLNSAFATVPPLQNGLRNLVDCILGSKIRTLQQVSEAIATKSHLAFPRINSDALIGFGYSEVRSQLVNAQSIMQSASPNTSVTGTARAGLTARSADMPLTVHFRRDQPVNSTTDSSQKEDDRQKLKRQIESLFDAYKAILRTQILPFLALTCFGSTILVFGILHVITWTLRDLIFGIKKPKATSNYQDYPPSAMPLSSAVLTEENKSPTALQWLNRSNSARNIGSEERPTLRKSASATLMSTNPQGTSSAMLNAERERDAEANTSDDEPSTKRRSFLASTFDAAIQSLSPALSRSKSTRSDLQRSRSAPRGPRPMVSQSAGLDTSGVALPRSATLQGNSSGPRVAKHAFDAPDFAQFIKQNEPAATPFTEQNEVITKPLEQVDQTIMSKWMETLRPSLPANHPLNRHSKLRGNGVEDEWDDISKEASKAVAMLAARARQPAA
ncbi:hypothetical protein DFS34DRAFT_596972 [Phlyctochytrium arcticum]|nr:hypothetical protein DFS34DRAFT_596972 [Phlyctochytrium arcticum]